MYDRLQLRMPTGIASLDPVLDGGVPPGSVVLLLGEDGAGSVEFVQTSLMSFAIGKQGAAGEHLMLPESVSYVTLTRMKEDILEEIALSFNPDLYEQLEKEIVFHDLSNLYFDASTVPPGWYGEGNVIERMQKKQRREEDSILAEIVRLFDECPKNSQIILDSLTDIAPPLMEGTRRHAFVAFLRGLQRATKRWGTTVYLLLTSGILDRSQELEIADCVDATIFFHWEEAGAQRRQRVMYFGKFRGVMPHLESKDLVKFAVSVSATGGFEVRNIRVVV
ncbi:MULTISPECIES: RAD55 family ATPase [unclassified Methanoculleus]|jgi:KaiC/GvpD/RAD55 family RecA-like ATPase|uniref:ATPase domain-containing protein n=1 Tax=Methanoculleus palmolei TaxID=72612 RepID=A0ABD8A6X4_9EURY|nr:ATPase domain-containing protein [Methanoculleus sp. UBA377]MDD2472493.1 ATPase domain-containing protein [Methanoculleus sp.]WOX54855.1 ATPase domain-containing protein [Methanoculleus palmolei]